VSPDDDVPAAADAEPLTAAEAPAPEAPAADAESAEQNAQQAFAAAGEPPPWDDRLAASGEALTERPEALVGAAFAGGVVFALILKRLVR
jgi:hypothetical protein